jgi:transposase InsO family protein
MQLAQDYPLKLICKALELARSTFYYQPKPRQDQALRRAIERVIETWPRYGYRRITEQLKREGWAVNSKRIRRLMREMGLQAVRKRQKRRTTDSRHTFPRFPNLVQGLEIVRPDQVWAADITYIRLRKGFVYLAVIMDVFTRAIRGWHLGRGLDQSLTMTALEKALQKAQPEIHHSDQGVQYAATEYVETLWQAGVQISMADIGDPTQNGHVERLIRTIKEEEVDLSEYENYHDAYHQIERFLEDVYMFKRIHSSLGYLTPAEFERDWMTRETMEVSPQETLISCPI